MSSPEIKHDLFIKFGSEYGPEEERAVLDVLHQNAPTSGDACIQFEKDFAEYCGTKYARCVSNGTAALFMSMVALDIKPGDRVITTPMTWIATAAAAVTLGPRSISLTSIPIRTISTPPSWPPRSPPRPRPSSRSISTANAATWIPSWRSRTNMESPSWKMRHRPLGVSTKAARPASMGLTGCFSFHEQKNMSTLGEGGMVVTDDPDIFERIALYRSHCTRVHGKSTKYCSLDEAKFPVGKTFWWQDFDDCGYNFRMTDIQAAVGIEQLKKLDDLNERRKQNAALFDSRLVRRSRIEVAGDAAGKQTQFPPLSGHDRSGCSTA